MNDKLRNTQKKSNKIQNQKDDQVQYCSNPDTEQDHRLCWMSEVVGLKGLGKHNVRSQKLCIIGIGMTPNP